MKYCEEWSSYEHGPHNPLTRDEALTAFNNKTPYIFYQESDDGNIYQYTKCYGDEIYVVFFDELIRMDLTYSFKLVDGKYFLSLANFWEFVDDGNEWSKRDTYHFKQDHVNVNTFIREGKQKIQESFEHDGASNWEELPEFDCFERFTRRER